MIYTSNSLFAWRRDDPAEMMRLNSAMRGRLRDDPAEMRRLNSAMRERFIRIRTWVNPIPPEHRIINFPRCGKCRASFFLTSR